VISEDIEPPAGEPLAIAFFDVEGYTEFTAVHGDHAGLQLADSLLEIAEQLIAGADGRVIKRVGDGVIASFGSADSALRCAVGVRRALSARAEMDPEAPIAAAKIALHWGTPLRRDDDLYGNDVNLAARMVDQAKGGQILVSDPLRRELGDVPPPPPMKKAGKASGKGLKERPALWSVEAPEDRETLITRLGEGVLATFLFDPAEADAEQRPEAEFWAGMRAAEAVFNGFGAVPVFAGRRNDPELEAPAFCVLVSFPTVASWETFMADADDDPLRRTALAVIDVKVLAAYTAWPQLGTLFPPTLRERAAED
jgi:class 3 adenylate cyclase